MPAVSIVVPVYNTEKYLDKCIKSILNQTFTDIELICVNDGSTDGSRAVLKKYEDMDKRVSVIDRDAPSGSAAVPRNIGIRNARGKYIVFFDSDDYMSEQMIEKMYNAAECTKVEMVMCDNYIVSSENEIIAQAGELHHDFTPPKEVFSYKDIPKTIFQISNAAIWHKMILKDVIERNSIWFQEGVPILDDIYFVNMLSVLSTKICWLDEKLMYYRKGRPGAQTRTIEKNYGSIFKAFDTLYRSLKQKAVYNEVEISLKNWTLIMMAWWYSQIGDRRVAQKLFKKYQDEYMRKWDLLNMNKGDMCDYNIDFYRYFAREPFRPSIKVVLNEINQKNARLILYGAGKVGRDVYKYIVEDGNHDIVAWCDRNAESIEHAERDIITPDKINNYDYEAIIIAILSPSIAVEAKKQLIKQNINESKIFTMI